MKLQSAGYLLDITCLGCIVVFTTTERGQQKLVIMDICMFTEETCQKDPVCGSVFISERGISHSQTLTFR